jgi:hypothetical protein
MPSRPHWSKRINSDDDLAYCCREDAAEVGPIALPKKLAASLQVGWMITCELVKSNTGWRIIDVGNIYPSLPFK